MTLNKFPVRVSWNEAKNKFDKKPTCVSWQHPNFTPEQLEASINYGIEPPKGVFIIDLDTYKGVTRNDVENILNCELEWDLALLQTTPSKGEHYAFRIPDNIEIQQGSDLFGVNGFDTRCNTLGWIASGEGYEDQTLFGIDDVLTDPEQIPMLPEIAQEKLKTHSFNSKLDDLDEAISQQPLDITTGEIRYYLNSLDPNYYENETDWYRVGMAVYHQTKGSEKGRLLFDEFSKRGGNYDETENLNRWNSFNSEGKLKRLTFASVIRWAGGLKIIDPETGELVENNFVDTHIYIQSLNKYLDINTKKLLGKDAFNITYNRQTPLPDNGRKQLATNYAANKIKLAYGTMYAPNLSNTFEHENITYANSCCLLKYSDDHECNGEPELIQQHIEHLIDDEKERQYFLYYLAYNVQHPGIKIPWAIVLQGVEGDGKSFFAEMMRVLLGFSNVRSLDAQTLTQKFTGWAAGQCMTFIEELKLDNMQKYDICNMLKPYIANTTVEMVKKGHDPIVIPNTTNYICLTNNQDAIPISNGDRRYCVLFSRWQCKTKLEKFMNGNPKYYEKLYSTLKDNPAAIYHWLKNIEIPRWFINLKRAPDTIAKQQMRELSKSDDRLTIENIISNAGNMQFTDINSEIVNLTKLKEIYFDQTDTMTGNTIKNILLDMGYSRLGQIQIKAGYKPIIYAKGNYLNTDKAKEAVKAQAQE